MQVILLQRVAKLGQMGDVVDVKPGFARNYLLPQKKDSRARKPNLRSRTSRRKQKPKQWLPSSTASSLL